MPSYTKSEARAWAREKMLGVANVTIPTMTNDFAGLNEKAARHDIETTIAMALSARWPVRKWP
jgi:4-hydroxy-tetrahydrodipicolinate synthase